MIVAHHVLDWLPLSEGWIRTQIRAQRDAGVSPFVICDSLMGLLPDDPDVFPLGPRSLTERFVRRLGRPTYNPRMTRLLQEKGAEILHSHFGQHGWHDLDAAREAGCRHVVSFYGADATALPHQRPEWRARYRRMFGAIDLVLCEGPAFADTIAALGCPRQKLRIHPLGIVTDDYPFAPVFWDGRSPLRFLLAGRFVEKKGFDVAIEAIGRIAQYHPVEITIIGGSNPAQLKTMQAENAMRRALDMAGLSASVRWLGFVPNPVLAQEARTHHFYMASSVTAADGDQEGGAPVSAIEMQAIGLPVIGSLHCDIPFVVNQGVRLSPERDVADLSRQIEDWIGNSGVWRERLEQGRRHVEENFDAARQGQRAAQLYRHLGR